MPTAIQNSSLTRVHKLTYTPIPDVMDNEERANAYPPSRVPNCIGEKNNRFANSDANPTITTHCI